MAEILKRDDITENVIIIKINKSYESGMDAERLYDVTRGCWKVSIAYASQADYALSVVFGEVKEVYKIFEWVPASEERRKTIEYDAEKEESFSKAKWPPTILGKSTFIRMSKDYSNVVKLIRLRSLWRNDIVEAIARISNRY